MCPSLRTTLSLCGALPLASLLLTSCAAAPPQTPREIPAPVAPAPAPARPVAPGVQAPQAPAHDPNAQYGGRVQIATDRPVDSLLVYPDSSSNPRIYLSKLIYEPLLWQYMEPYPTPDFRQNIHVIPLLAESWQQTAPTTYLFKIRQGVRWHDGAEFTAEDPAWSYDYLRDPKNAFANRSFVDALAASKVIDKYTLELTSKTPDYRFLFSLTAPHIPILPKHIVDGGKGDLSKQPVGTGPYKLKEWTPKVEITHARNEEYWGKRPYLDGVRHITNLDRAAVTAAFITRQSDIIQLPDKPQADAITRQARDPQVVGFVRDPAREMSLRLDRPPFNDLRVRKALHLALDRQGMNETLVFGLGIANPPGMIGARTDWAIPQEELLKMPGYRQPKDQDYAESRRLLAEAGYGDGLKFTVRAETRDTQAPKQAEYLAEQLKPGGFDMKLELMETAAFRKAFAEADYEAAIGGGPDWNPEDFWLRSLRSTGSLNNGNVNDKQLDNLITSHLESFEPAKQKQTAQALQRLLLDKLYTIPTVTPSAFMAMQPYLHGWTPNYGGAPYTEQWYYVWVEKDKVPAGR